MLNYSSFLYEEEPPTETDIENKTVFLQHLEKGTSSNELKIYGSKIEENKVGFATVLPNFVRKGVLSKDAEMLAIKRDLREIYNRYDEH